MEGKCGRRTGDGRRRRRKVVEEERRTGTGGEQEEREDKARGQHDTFFGFV